jgi:hypothetical protein
MVCDVRHHYTLDRPRWPDCCPKAMERHAKRINGQLGELITAVTKSAEAASLAASAAALALEQRDAGRDDVIPK